MSGPYRAYPGNGNQPFSSGSQANQPVSFKTDINRKKTKKWVSAKSVSYDGDDWGDDDDEEEEEEEEETPPLPTDASRFSANQQQSSSNFQPNQPASISVATPQSTNPPESKKSEPASSQTPAFVRPADIYKRMQEEREKERFSEDSSRSGSLPPTAAPPSAPSPLAIAQDSHEGVTTLRGENVEPSTSPLVIPELKRLSGFGQDFLGSSAYSEQTSQPVQAAQQQGQTEDLPLHHNPSLGFRSVVNQAFDVPETPTSSNGNFSRSNSDSTSVISPIISRTNVESEKTPTITEDIAGEASAQGPPADFRPGHRRDLSIPAPGNGPDRVPEVSNVEPSHSAEVVSSALSGNNLSAPDTDSVESSVSKDQPESGEATPHPSSVPHASIENPSLYTAPVENLNGPQKEQLQQREPTPLEIPQSKSQEIPQIVPSMSTETSPQDMESDRLRKEIMRSLSPDPTSASASPNPETIDFRKSQYRPGHESTYLPSEYDSYWNDQKDVTPTSPLQPKPTTTTPASVPSTEPLSLTINPKAVSETVSKEPETDSAVSETQRTLKKRFSWEATDDSDEEDVLEEQSEKTPIAPTVQSPSSSKNAQFTAPAAFGDDVTRDTALQDEIGAFDDHGLPRYSTIARETTQPPEESAVEIAGPLRESSSIPTQEAPALGSQTVTPIESPVPSPALQKQPTHPLGAEASLPSFRKIMDIQSPSEKVRAFNETREQFALIDNGLEDWIRRSSESLPEHADLIRLNGQLPGGAPTGVLPPKAKFPKLTSLGNLSLPSSHSHGDGLGYSPSHARRPSGSPLTSGMNRQNVESKGKDLLHSAGVLGGKAGGAARGLFAKGKNKLRGGADKGKTSIFSGRRRSTQLTNVTLVSEIDLTQEESHSPPSPLESSRYSLQPVPRIPSFKFNPGQSFSNPFKEENTPSEKPRAVSLDLGTQLKPVFEEEPSIFRQGSSSSLRRAMMQFDVAAVDPADSGDLHSPPSHSSGRQVSYSTVNDKGKEVESLPRNGNVLQSNGFVASRSFQPSAMVKPEPLNRQLSGPDTNIGTSLSAVSSLSNDDNYKLSLDISEPLSKRPSSLVPREISIGSPGGTKQTNFQSTARGSSLEVPQKLAVVSSTLPAPNPPGNNQHNSPRIHHISRFYQSKDSTNEPNLNFAFEKTTPVDDSARSPVSPPLPETENAPTSDSNRRFSSSSQVSDISEDDMDRIREKFDEDGLYTKFRDPSPTGSQVSALSEDEDDDVDAALEEKLAEVGYHEDPQKDLPTQPARRAQAPRRQSQPISVVRISRFSQDRRISQSAESNKRLSRHSRFSFESDRHAIAEAMLVTGYRKPKLIDSSQEQEVSTQIPVTLGEEAPDDPPPPFENPAAPYSPDNKEVNENETTPTYDPRRDSQADTRRPSASTTLPQYQPIESLSPNHEPTWRKSQLPEPQTHRDSHRSSVSSLSNTVANTQGPRPTISPEPQPSQSSNQVSFNSNIQKSKAKDAINAVNRLGKSRWTDGRLAAGAHSRPLSGDSGPPTGSSNFFGPGRREEDSLGSGDSMAVQAALSRHDLHMDPSPLNQESETASATSGKSFKLSVPFKNRIKFVGKRARGSSIDAPSVDSNAESKKSLDMSKDSDKNPEAKRGAFSKITGMFNRSSLGQPVEGKHRASQDAPSVNSQHRENQLAAHRANTWTVPASHQYAQQQPSSYPSSQQQPQPATLISHNKGLPPPPSGYYAPQPSPPTESLHGHSSQGYSYHPDNIGAYRPYPENHYSIKSPHSVYSPEQRNSGSSHSYSVGSPMSGIPSTPWQKPSSPEPLERGRSRAQDLRLRSRSPVSQTVGRRTVDRFDGNVNYSDPIYNLGKFNAVTETSRIGDQSTPFPITLPEGMERDPLSPRNSIQPEPMAYNRKTSNAGLGLLQSRTTVHSIAAATAVANVAREAVSNNPPALSIPEESKPTSLSNSQSEASRDLPTDGQAPESTPYYDDRSVIAKNSVPVELPVPRDDDSEEIVMSSTAYPGQEWQPSGYENWMMPY